MKSIIILASILVVNLFSAQEMSTHFKEAQQEAQSENKKLILVFSGSDWCVPCMKLEKYILSTPEFQNAIEPDYVMVNADFPQKKKNKELQSPEIQAQNKELAEKYNPNGYFPFVVVFDQNMKVIGNLTYEEISPKEYVEKIAAFYQ